MSWYSFKKAFVSSFFLLLLLIPSIAFPNSLSDLMEVIGIVVENVDHLEKEHLVITRVENGSYANLSGVKKGDLLGNVKKGIRENEMIISVIRDGREINIPINLKKLEVEASYDAYIEKIRLSLYEWYERRVNFLKSQMKRIESDFDNYEQGNMLYKKGLFYKAIESLKKVSDSDSDLKHRTLYLLGTIYYNLKNYEASINVLEKLYKDEEILSDFHRALVSEKMANVYIRKGEPFKAEEHLRLFVEKMEPGKKGILVDETQTDGYFQFELELLYLNLGLSYAKKGFGSNAILNVIKAEKIATNKKNIEIQASARKILRKMYKDFNYLPEDFVNIEIPDHKFAKANPRTPKKMPAFISSGTGFIIGKSGHILTNYHVVKKSKDITIKIINGERVKAEAVAWDAHNDIAILKVNSLPGDIQGDMYLGDSSKVKEGDKVSTIGYPFSNILGHQARYSEGIVNSLYGIQDDPRLFQISVPIQRGNSGAPLFNERGEVIGIVVASLDAKNVFEITGSFPQNINFAIKSAYIKNILSMLPELGSMLVQPTDLSLSQGEPKSFMERTKNNIVLIEAK